MSTVLLLEDDESVSRGIAFTLEREGYEVQCARCIRDARAMFGAARVSALICDINLPDGSGLDFISWVRERSDAYIICLTALDQEPDQVMGYHAGADDYMTKPFSLSVLTLKLQAYFERMFGKGRRRLISGELEVQPQAQRAYVRGQEVCLTKNEWRLLLLFLEHPKQILSKNQILEQLFDLDGSFVEENTVAVNIARLREKIERDKAKPQYIKNVRGLGYLWNQECEGVVCVSGER